MIKTVGDVLKTVGDGRDFHLLRKEETLGVRWEGTVKVINKDKKDEGSKTDPRATANLFKITYRICNTY